MRRAVAAVLLLLTLMAAAGPAAALDKEKVLSAKERAALDRSVDEILKFVSEGTALEIRAPVARAFVDREGLRAHFEQELKPEDTQRLRRSELVLKKLGLLPRDFDLIKFSLELALDRVAGYYDTKKKTIFLLDYISAVRQKPILAHELMHALQDQHYGITEWAKAIAEVKPELPDEKLEEVLAAEEAAFARRAVIEGQANVALVEYAKHSAEEWAGPVSIRSRSAMRAPVMMALIDGPGESEIYKSAPVVLKESSRFSYYFGYLFIRALLDKGSTPLAFDEVMRRPPVNARQIMQPKAYLNHERLEPVHVPVLKPVLGEKWRRLDAGLMGAFDVYVLGQHFEGQGTAEKLAKRWRGGVHYAAVPAERKDEELNAAEVALLYLSRWENEKAAEDFARRQAKWLKKKYAQVTPAGESAWDMEEGRVVIEASGDEVLVLEGFPPALIAAVRATVWTSAP